MDISMLSYEERLWQQLYMGARQALEAGQPADALRDFEAAVNVAEEFGQDDERLVKALTGLGMTHMLLKNFDEAEQPLNRAYELTTKFRGSAHPDCLGLLKHMATVATGLKKFDKAGDYFDRALAIYDKIEPNSEAARSLREQKQMVIGRARQAANNGDSDGKPQPETKQPASKEVAKPAAPAKPAAAETAPANGKSVAQRPAASAPASQEPVLPAASMPPIDPDNLSGAVIDNRYQIYGRIGEGGMSAIYRGKHLLMDRQVAIKILHKHLTLSQKVKERFKQESRTVSKLQHPNIVGVHDFGEAHGFFYLVMDYVDGISLADLIKEVDRLPADRCVNILMQICDGLQHAHDHGILHRDLKPSNIMLVQQGTSNDFVKIVDFGIAKNIDREEGDEHSLQLTQTGETVGSPLYMSPEQCRGDRLDSRSDIYSLGCLAYKALAGVPPFGGNNQIDVYIKHTQVQAPPFAKSYPGLKVPPQLEHIVLKMLEKKPEDRFSSMNEVRGALNLFNAQENWN
jgi:eukaryotic-like serine/threonine-protein kinase